MSFKQGFRRYKNFVTSYIYRYSCKKVTSYISRYNYRNVT